MAEYYTQYSCEFDVGTAENATRAIEIYETEFPWNDPDRPYDQGFLVSPVPGGGPGELWMRDDGSGDPDMVIEFVKACAKAFGLKGCWGFEYANTCSRPAPNAFGGGAHLLDLGSGECIGFMDTNGWLAQSIAEVGSNA